MESIKCDYCDVIFNSTDSWLYHTLQEMRICYENYGILYCMNCEFPAQNITDLRIHISKRSCKEGIVRQDKCSNCLKLFTQKAGLNKHIQNKTCFIKMPMMCMTCGQQFSKPCAFKNHQIRCSDMLDSFDLQDMETLFSPRTAKQLDLEFEMIRDAFDM